MSTGGKTAPQFQVDGEKRMGERWLLRLTGAGMGYRSVGFQTGQVAWRRFLLLPTATTIWNGRNVFIEGGGGVAAALVRAEGQGFSTNLTDSAMDLGVASTVRVGGRLGGGPATLWVGATGLFWIRPQQASLDGGMALGTLPRWDLFLVGGVTFLLGG